MAKYEKITAILLAVMFVFGTAPYARAATFNDVTEADWGWAISAIDKITNMGILSGDDNGNFYPNGMLDKFETSRILAMVAGFKTENATQSELEYYDICYNKHKSLIDQYVNKFSKWNSDTNMQVAFLLEEGILNENDLMQFVVLVDGVEKLRGLSREEACMFFARVLDEADLAREYTPSELFKDDANIDATAKPYVYYLRFIGVVGGDPEGNFAPKNPVVRATMAVMLEKVITRMGYTTPTVTINPTPAPTQAPSASYGAVSGVITKVYSAFRAVEVMNGSNGRKIYPVLTSAYVSIDGKAAAFEDVAEGMSVAGILVNGEISELTAVSAAPTQTQAPVQTQAPTQTQAPAAPAPPQTAKTVIEGTVKTTISGESGRYIDILVRLLSSRGDIFEETRSFLLDSSCVVKRGSAVVDFEGIAPGDLIKAEISGTTVYSIEMEEKDRAFGGTLIAKRLIETTGVPVLSISDEDGKVHELVVADSTSFSRSGVYGIITWKDIRIGDYVDVTAEFDRALTVYAVGSKSSYDGWITRISISLDSSEITVIDEYGTEKTYPIISGQIDPYELRVGSKIGLYLDSAEVEGVAVLQDGQTDFYTGFVTSINGNTLTVRDASGQASAEPTKICVFNTNTIIMDSLLGTRVALSDMFVGMKVYIVFENSSSNYARTITILSH